MTQRTKLIITLKKKYISLEPLESFLKKADEITRYSDLKIKSPIDLDLIDWEVYLAVTFYKINNEVIDILNESVKNFKKKYEIFGKDMFEIKLYEDWNISSSYGLILNDFKFNLGIIEYIKEDV